MSKLGPATRPCSSCPYRRDVPSGIWSKQEYDKLPEFDRPGWAQPPKAFFCHLDNGRLCAGWVGCHDMMESLGLRIALAVGLISAEDAEAALDYVSPVELFASGAEAAAHGCRDIEHPEPEAIRAAQKLGKRTGKTFS